MKRFLLLSAAVGALVLAPSALASAHSSTGTVIALTRGGVLVAGGKGFVSFAPGHARVGSRVVLTGSSLRIVGFTHAARVRGVVAARRGNLLVLSAAHRLFPMRMRARVPAAVSSRSGPEPGDVVAATVSIDEHGNVVATSTEDEGQVVTAQVQATITAIGTNTITLNVNGQSLVLPLPAGTTVPPTLLGTQVTLTLTFANGTTVANEDEQGENEDNDDNDQGDDGNQISQHDGGDDGGDSSGGNGDG
jgi:hypothetical protein